MANRPSRLVIGCPTISTSTGRYEGRYPLGNAPSPLAGNAADIATAAAALQTSIRLAAAASGAASASGDLTTGGLPLLYSTNFDSMTTGSAPSGGPWVGTGAGPNLGASSTIKVSTAVARSGSKSLEFNFNGPTGGLCEMDLNLGGSYTQFRFDFWLHIPSNYAHSTNSPNNNKFFRIGAVYPVSSGYGRLGASLIQNADGVSSDLEMEWEDLYNHHGGGFTNFPGGTWGDGTVDKFIGPSDLGQWMHVVIDLKCPTALDATDTNPSAWGKLDIYKNGVLVSHNTPNCFHDSGTNFWSYAYLFGATNAPPATQELIYMDDFAMSGS